MPWIEPAYEQEPEPKISKSTKFGLKLLLMLIISLACGMVIGATATDMRSNTTVECSE